MPPRQRHGSQPAGSRSSLTVRGRRKLLRSFGGLLCLTCGYLLFSGGEWLGSVLHLSGPTYDGYAGEAQRVLTTTLAALSRVQLARARGAPSDRTVAYRGYSPLVCPDLIATVVVPELRSCRALCQANNGGVGPRCAAFTFTPAGRCYLSKGGPAEPVWEVSDVPGVHSGTVRGGLTDRGTDTGQRPEQCEVPATPLRPVGGTAFVTALTTEDSKSFQYSKKGNERGREGQAFEQAW